MSEISHTEITSTNPLTKLIDPNRHVGFVISMNFDEAVFLTNDFWKETVRGVPMNSFLLGAAFYADNWDATPEIDREIILLRVLGQEQLPHSKDNLLAMIESYSKRTQLERAKKGGEGPDVFEFDQRDGFDPHTLVELQFGAMRAGIVGTFYMRSGALCLGADIENFASATHLRVYKPDAKALKTIVNFIDPNRKQQADQKARELGFPKAPESFNLGTVRYTSADRLNRGPEESHVALGINPIDFLSRRTAVLGMTRTGKSNMIKTLVSAVGLAAVRGRVRIGQCIFDINGEYANANSQDDGSSIADVFGDDVVCYRGMKTNKPGFRDLRNNFYERPDVGLAIINEQLADENITANDMSNLLNMSLDEPEEEDFGEKTRYERKLAAFSALLKNVGYAGWESRIVKFSVDQNVLRQIFEKNYPDAVNEKESEKGKPLTLEEKKALAKEHYPSFSSGVTIDQALTFFRDVRRALKKIEKDAANPPTGFYATLKKSPSADPWLDQEMRSLLNLIERKSETDSFIKVDSLLRPIAEHHSPDTKGQIEVDIYRLLERGKIVIVDLSVGVESVREAMAERIGRHIFNRSMQAFHTAATPPSIVMYVEEAHNLIGRDSKPDETWPRIAKEGAKANIALVYATQEPSSVQPNILANTENWVITHLNNDEELRVLSRYYDFKDFAQSLKRAQDPGFARVKALSSPFVVPVQIDQFRPQEIKIALDSVRAESAPSDNAPSNVVAEPDVEPWE